MEYLLIKKVDHIFVVSESIADWYEKTYNIPRPTVLFNAPPAMHIKKNNYFKDTFYLRDDQVIILYQGLLASERGIDILLEAFKKNTNDKTVIVFMGFGKLDIEIQSASRSYKNIFFHKPMSNDMLIKVTASADIGVAIFSNICLSHNFCMPNKLFEYAMAGLPIITSNTKDLGMFVKKHQIGTILKNNTVEDFRYAIDELLSMDLTTVSQNSRKAALENSWEYQEAKMKEVYQNLF